VRNEEFRIADFLKPLGHLVSVEFTREAQGLAAKRAFKREQFSRFPSHGRDYKQVYAYKSSVTLLWSGLNICMYLSNRVLLK
jgi:hypothetical protein